MRNIYLITKCSALLLICTASVMAQPKKSVLDEQYRPQIHFSPAAHWINDPNGMVYSNGIYHLFYQYHPYSSVWGPMHWGHASSSDMVHWKELPIAIYPDSIGTIFSGSAVMDINNTSGFGKKGTAPLVAIFTQHNMEGEKAGKNDFQNQSIAYSVDGGNTWIKYAANPVLTNPGIKDFRDPKVMWYASQKKWIMTLATKDYITFYSSPNLKNWTKESEFGKTVGAHAGVWECPDLISINDNGKQRWVLIVNLNPGGPNGGSGTQYFIGNFDGKNFTSSQTDIRWMDYGPDNYAGVTWSNTGKRNLLIGWMSNWNYAGLVPTEKWKNALTIPRELHLKHIGEKIFLTSKPVAELSVIQSLPKIAKNITLKKSIDISTLLGKIKFPCSVNVTTAAANNFLIILSNNLGEELVIGFDKTANQYFIDRTKSGNTAFAKDFAAKHVAPRLTDNAAIKITMIIDVSSIELFADDGLTVMTEIFFPNQPYNQIRLQSNDGVKFGKIEYIGLSKTKK